MNNKICWLLIISLFPAYLRAQSITPNTLNNGGGTMANMDWNMGESVSIANFSTPNYFLNTGVLQPMTSIVTAINEYGPAVYGNQIMIGPNPTTNLVHFKGNFTQAGKLSIQVIDAKSSVILTHEAGIIISSYEKDIFMDSYPSGIFYIKVFFKPTNGLAKTGIYKIIKL
ncbi:MAG: hypothetical protein EBU05_09365 [Chitinophagia bacterium]|jgi:hypothetical protein|nr:hypothetical protein [Chitinophagia bacterium]